MVVVWIDAWCVLGCSHMLCGREFEFKVDLQLIMMLDCTISRFLTKVVCDMRQISCDSSQYLSGRGHVAHALDCNRCFKARHWGKGPAKAQSCDAVARRCPRASAGEKQDILVRQGRDPDLPTYLGM